MRSQVRLYEVKAWRLDGTKTFPALNFFFLVNKWNEWWRCMKLFTKWPLDLCSHFRIEDLLGYSPERLSDISFYNLTYGSDHDLVCELHRDGNSLSGCWLIMFRFCSFYHSQWMSSNYCSTWEGANAELLLPHHGLPGRHLLAPDVCPPHGLQQSAPRPMHRRRAHSH